MTDSIAFPPGYIPGCLPRTDAYGETFRPAARYRSYPRADWDRYAASNLSSGLLVRRVHNQGQEGSCNPQGAVQGLAITLAQMNRNWCPPDGFSAMPPYKALARGPNQGTVISDVLVYLRDKGTLPLDTPKNREWMRKYGMNPEHVMPETGYYAPMPKGCEETQRYFRISEALECGRSAEIVAAILDNKVGVSGCDGHAMCYIQARKVNGVWYIDHVNSWGRNGGPLGPEPAFQYGLRSISEQRIDSQINMYGSYTIERAVIPEQFMR